jgi:hypothetical protein
VKAGQTGAESGCLQATGGCAVSPWVRSCVVWTWVGKQRANPHGLVMFSRHGVHVCSEAQHACTRSAVTWACLRACDCMWGCVWAYGVLAVLRRLMGLASATQGVWRHCCSASHLQQAVSSQVKGMCRRYSWPGGCPGSFCCPGGFCRLVLLVNLACRCLCAPAQAELASYLWIASIARQAVGRHMTLG